MREILDFTPSVWFSCPPHLIAERSCSHGLQNTHRRRWRGVLNVWWRTKLWATLLKYDTNEKLKTPSCDGSLHTGKGEARADVFILIFSWNSSSLSAFYMEKNISLSKKFLEPVLLLLSIAEIRLTAGECESREDKFRTQGHKVAVWVSHAAGVDRSWSRETYRNQ